MLLRRGLDATAALYQTAGGYNGQANGSSGRWVWAGSNCFAAPGIRRRSGVLCQCRDVCAMKIINICILTVALLTVMAQSVMAQGYLPPKPPLPANSPSVSYWSWREMSVSVPKRTWYNDSSLAQWLRANYPGWRYIGKHISGTNAFRAVLGRWTLMTAGTVIIPKGTEYGGAVYCRKFPGDPACRRRG